MKKKDKAAPDAAELRRRAEGRLKKKQREQDGKGATPLQAEEPQRLIHELQVHQVELEMQNEELQKSRAEVEAGLALYADLYDFAPVGYFTLDRNGTIRRANLTGARLLGTERSWLAGQRFWLFVSEAGRPAFNAFLEKVFASREKETCEAALLKQEKSPLSPGRSGIQSFGGTGRLMVSVEAIASVDGQECRAVMTDITDRKRMEANLQESHARLERNLRGAIDVISEMIETKSLHCPGYHRHVSALTSAIAREMGLTPFQVQSIELASGVYDIGLINIPLEFLQDTNRLEGVKLAMYHEYPRTGRDVLKKLEFPWPITEIIFQHRECFDGSGFPRGLKGADILVEARILAVAESITDLTSNKAYRNALTLDQALGVISNSSGALYDPDVVSACQRLVNEKGYRMTG